MAENKWFVVADQNHFPFIDFNRVASPSSQPVGFLRSASVIDYRDALGRYTDFHSLRKTLGTNLAKAGVARRTAMSVMRHSDGKLTDKIYTDENLLGVETAIDVLPTFTGKTGTPSQIASQKPVLGGHGVTQAVTIPALNELLEPIEKKAKVTIWHWLAGVVTMMINGGSGGARTRNLCRDRAAL